MSSLTRSLAHSLTIQLTFCNAYLGSDRVVPVTAADILVLVVLVCVVSIRMNEAGTGSSMSVLLPGFEYFASSHDGKIWSCKNISIHGSLIKYMVGMSLVIDSR